MGSLYVLLLIIIVWLIAATLHLAGVKKSNKAQLKELKRQTKIQEEILALKKGDA